MLKQKNNKAIIATLVVGLILLGLVYLAWPNT